MSNPAWPLLRNSSREDISVVELSDSEDEAPGPAGELPAAYGGAEADDIAALLGAPEGFVAAKTIRSKNVAVSQVSVPQLKTEPESVFTRNGGTTSAPPWSSPVLGGGPHPPIFSQGASATAAAGAPSSAPPPPHDHVPRGFGAVFAPPKGKETLRNEFEGAKELPIMEEPPGGSSGSFAPGENLENLLNVFLDTLEHVVDGKGLHWGDRLFSVLSTNGWLTAEQKSGVVLRCLSLSEKFNRKQGGGVGVGGGHDEARERTGAGGEEEGPSGGGAGQAAGDRGTNNNSGPEFAKTVAGFGTMKIGVGAANFGSAAAMNVGRVEQHQQPSGNAPFSFWENKEVPKLQFDTDNPFAAPILKAAADGQHQPQQQQPQQHQQFLGATGFGSLDGAGVGPAAPVFANLNTLVSEGFPSPPGGAFGPPSKAEKSSPSSPEPPPAGTSSTLSLNERLAKRRREREVEGRGGAEGDSLQSAKRVKREPGTTASVDDAGPRHVSQADLEFERMLQQRQNVSSSQFNKEYKPAASQFIGKNPGTFPGTAGAPNGGASFPPAAKAAPKASQFQQQQQIPKTEQQASHQPQQSFFAAGAQQQSSFAAGAQQSSFAAGAQQQSSFAAGAQQSSFAAGAQQQGLGAAGAQLPRDPLAPQPFNPIPPQIPLTPDTRAKLNQAKNLLQSHFGFPAFRSMQEAAVSALLSGRDVLTVMPTGSGKSLCYQLPALMEKTNGKVCIVISPLKSLMKDQVDRLNRMGIPAASLSDCPDEKKLLESLM